MNDNCSTAAALSLSLSFSFFLLDEKKGIEEKHIGSSTGQSSPSRESLLVAITTRTTTI